MTADIPVISRGVTLYQRCLATIKTIDEPSSAITVYATGALCTGYLDGFADGLNMAHDVVCVSGSSVATMARVYVAYMQSHPKLMDEHMSIGLTLALSNAFPCSKK